MTKPISRCHPGRAVSLLLLVAAFSVPWPAIAEDPIFPIPAREDRSDAEIPTFDRVLFAQRPVAAPLGSGQIELTDDPTDGKPSFLVTGQQVGMQVEEPPFVTPSTQLSWSWKKQEGVVCIVQVQLRNAATGQTRYLGYAAGAWSEPLSADPTIEFTVSPEVPWGVAGFVDTLTAYPT